MAAMVSSNMTDSGSSANRCLSPATAAALAPAPPAPSPASDPAVVAPITVSDEAPRLLERLAQALQVQHPSRRADLLTLPVQAQHSHFASLNAPAAAAATTDDTCPAAAPPAPIIIFITVNDEAPPRLPPGRLAQAAQEQDPPRVWLVQALHPHAAPLQNALLVVVVVVVEHSPQPQPDGWACMRTPEHAPQRQPARCDRAKTPPEQEGQPHDLPCEGRLQEMQEHPEPQAAERPTVLLLLLPTVWWERREVEEAAPPTKLLLLLLPAGIMKKDSTLLLPAYASAAEIANREVNFMCSTSVSKV